MKKSEQIAMNAKVDAFMQTLPNMHWLRDNTLIHGAQLRNCHARVSRFAGGLALVSYRTLIAVIDNNGVCYDFLRKVYGYTNTSAQHIRKFMEDYNATSCVRWDYI